MDAPSDRCGVQVSRCASQHRHRCPHARRRCVLSCTSLLDQDNTSLTPPQALLTHAQDLHMIIALHTTEAEAEAEGCTACHWPIILPAALSFVVCRSHVVVVYIYIYYNQYNSLHITPSESTDHLPASCKTIDCRTPERKKGPIFLFKHQSSNTILLYKIIHFLLYTTTVLTNNTSSKD
jgi:hypothetical protein